MTQPTSLLWDQAVEGDGLAFAVFYRRHADTVFTHCLTRVQVRVDAEDLTAEVFTITWRRRQDVRFHETEDVLPWLLTTANLLLYQHYRTTTRRRTFLRRGFGEHSVSDIAEAIVDDDADKRTRAAALAVLTDLRPADRDIIELCLQHGMSTESVAQATGVPVGTVRSRLSRALSRARRRYAEGMAADQPTGVQK